MKIEIDIPDYAVTHIQDIAESAKYGISRKLMLEELVDFIRDDMISVYSENLTVGLGSAIQHKFD